MRYYLPCIIACVFFTSPLLAQETMPLQYRICTEMPVFGGDDGPVDSESLPPGFTARAVAYKPELGKYWANGSVIKVRFMGGTEVIRNKIRRYAQEWSDYANVTFVFVEKGYADVRIGFYPNMGTWSAIGTDVKRIEQHQPTMNFGWFDSRTPEWEVRATVLHEFGHTLGLLHEHQHPKGGIPWDKPKLYQYYQSTQGWNRSQVDQQVLGKLAFDRTQYTRYDPASIMHYPIPNALTVGDFEVNINRDLSYIDKAFIAKVYPKPKTTTTTRPVTGPVKNDDQLVTLSVRNELGRGQTNETVWLTVNGVTRKFTLQNAGKREHEVSFEIPRDQSCEYEIYTRTTVLMRMANGTIQEKVLNGYGKGKLTTDTDGCLQLTMGKKMNEKWVEVNLERCN